jgi:hypothetical protein
MMFQKLILLIFIFISLSFYSFCENEYEENGEDKLAMSVMVEYNFPTGDFEKFWDNGFGLFAQIEYLITNNTAIGIRGGYLSWKPDPDIKLSEGIYEYEYEFTSVPIIFNGRYNFIQDKYYIAYSGFLLGAYLSKDIKRQFQWVNNNRVKVYEEIKSDTHFNIAPIIGVLVPFGSFYLNINAAYNILFYPAYNRTFLSFYGGVTIPLII